MTTFQQNLKQHFQDLYVRKSMSKDLIAYNEKQLMDIAQGKELFNMQIEEGLKFLEV